MEVFLALDIPPFVMYCVNGKPRSSLFIESTDSMIHMLDCQLRIIKLDLFLLFPAMLHDFFSIKQMSGENAMDDQQLKVPYANLCKVSPIFSYMCIIHMC